MTLTEGNVPSGGNYQVGYGDYEFIAWSGETLEVEQGSSLGSRLRMDLGMAEYVGSGIYDPAPYTFGGWNTAADGSGTEYTASTPVTGDVTLYAQWVRKTCTVKLDGNKPASAAADVWVGRFDGINAYPWSPGDIVVDPGNSLGSDLRGDLVLATGDTSNPGAAPYAFWGWNTKPDGTGDVFVPMTPVNEDITLYAQWWEYIDDTKKVGYYLQGTTLYYETFQSSALQISWPAGLAESEKARIETIIVQDDKGAQLAVVDGAFQDCTKLQTVVLPASVDELRPITFNGCTNLSSVEMPGIKIIGKMAFNECQALTEITIPAGVTSIGQDAFQASTQALRTVRYGGTHDQWNAMMDGMDTDSDQMYISWPSGSEATFEVKTLGIPPAATFVCTDGSYQVGSNGKRLEVKVS